LLVAGHGFKNQSFSKVEYFLALLWWFNGFKSSFQTANQPLLFAGVVLLILTEIIVRYLFYASYYRVGV
jgi:hypothetical protein